MSELSCIWCLRRIWFGTNLYSSRGTMTTSLPWRNPSCMSLTSHAVFAGSGMTELRIAGASLVAAVSPNFRYGHHPTYTILGRDVRRALGPRPIVATKPCLPQRLPASSLSSACRQGMQHCRDPSHSERCTPAPHPYHLIAPCICTPLLSQLPAPSSQFPIPSFTVSIGKNDMAPS